DERVRDVRKDVQDELCRGNESKDAVYVCENDECGLAVAQETSYFSAGARMIVVFGGLVAHDCGDQGGSGVCRAGGGQASGSVCVGRCAHCTHNNRECYQYDGDDVDCRSKATVPSAMDTTRTSAREATAVDDRLHGGATVPGETLMTLTNTESATITKVTTTSDGGCKGEATATLRGPLTRAAKRYQQAAAKTRQAVRESDVGNSSEKPATANLNTNACCRRRSGPTTPQTARR
ncbi:hypothetical protein PF004_g26423, partial [Phytophthora fragariae]